MLHRILFIITLLFSFSAQANIVEIIAGGKYTHLQDKNEDISYSSRAGIQLGANVLLDVEAPWILRTGFVYSTSAYNATYERVLNISNVEEIRTHYLNIPLSFGKRLSDSLYIFTGSVFGFKLDENEHNLRDLSRSLPELETEPQFQPLMMSLHAGFNLHLGNDWSVEVSLQRSLLDGLDSDYSGPETSLSFNLHYEFY